MDSESISFELFVRRVIQTWNDEDQLYFLKVFPVFNNPINLLAMWIDVYTKYIAHKNKIVTIDNLNEELKTIKSRGAAGIFRRESIINFLLVGIECKYLKFTMNDIGEIMILMKEANEDPGCINSVKLSSMKLAMPSKSTTFLSRSQSVKTPNEISHQVDKRMTNTAREQFITKNIMECSDKDVALEFTRIQSELLLKIHIHEIVHLSANDKCHEALYPNLAKIIQNFDKLAYFIHSEIQKKQNISEKIKFVKKMINIACECKEINNLHSVVAIVAGLNHNSVMAIKDIWKQKYKHTQKLKELELFVGLAKNFLPYRQYVKTMGKKSIIPYIGIFLSDLKHALEYPIYNNKTNKLEWESYNALIELLKTFEPLNKRYVIPINKPLSTFFDKIRFDEYDDAKETHESPKSQEKIEPAPHRKSMSSSIKTNKQDNTNAGKKKLQIPISSIQSLKEKETQSVSITTEKENRMETLVLSEQDLSILIDKETDYQQTNVTQKDIVSVQSAEQKRRFSYDQGKRKRAGSGTSAEMKRQHSNEKTIPEHEETGSRTSQKERTKHLSIDLKLLFDNEDQIFKVETSPRTKKSPRRPRKSNSLSLCQYKEKTIYNSDISKWTIDNVAEWLQQIDMDEYISKFKENEIDGFILVDLTELHLKEELGINKLGHRLKIMKYLQQLKAITK